MLHTVIQCVISTLQIIAQDKALFKLFNCYVVIFLLLHNIKCCVCLAVEASFYDDAGRVVVCFLLKFSKVHYLQCWTWWKALQFFYYPQKVLL